jgi:microcompartment protein CcmL/EutN
VKPSFQIAGDARAAAPALGMLEVASIAAGYAAADRVAKEAPVRLLLCRPASPGKFLILFGGEVADVTSSLRAGTEGLAEPALDTLLLPNADPSLCDALVRVRSEVAVGAAGVVETSTVATMLVAADVAVKTADVELLAARAAMGLGGKSFFVVTGEVAQVRAAVVAAASFARSRGKLAGEVVIPAPHHDLDPFLR